ncbi:DUF1489 family protein [Brevundimonas sp. Root1279]|uniref:DUF1489 family protein n=1 Tax=Brevundimonas sp. Root1279 TaxID=1736443 RepID=UPI0006F6441B|nr:DUF1489 domain-containing protein [Brevundimonas sp. Root1279]KQW78686.1 hypothetical protein ASC65_15300 [Brevundimonas sp. Root1279]
MPLHMIKLCVGVSDVETLERNAERSDWRVVHTRMTPKRAAEIEDGGSLYWVIKGSVLCRQPILDISTVGEGAASRCEIKLASRVIRTAPLARRPFQGWRYFDKDVPPDLTVLEDGDLPADLAKQLQEMGAW